MRRGAMLGLGAVLVGVLAFAFLHGRPYRVPERPAKSPLTAATPQIVPNLPAATAPETATASAGLPLEGLTVPSLPSDAPESVSFGVIVFTYRGAEGAPPGAGPKDAAWARAKALLHEAQQNFEEAVKKGDHGSMVDAGSIPRGILEPAAEYALFSLKKGQVGAEPLDTPRGFWIVRRGN